MNLQSFKSTPDSLKQHLKGSERKLSLGAPETTPKNSPKVPEHNLKMCLHLTITNIHVHMYSSRLPPPSLPGLG